MSASKHVWRDIALWTLRSISYGRAKIDLGSTASFRSHPESLVNTNSAATSSFLSNSCCYGELYALKIIWLWAELAARFSFVPAPWGTDGFFPVPSLENRNDSPMRVSTVLLNSLFVFFVATHAFFPTWTIIRQNTQLLIYKRQVRPVKMNCIYWLRFFNVFCAFCADID